MWYYNKIAKKKDVLYTTGTDLKEFAIEARLDEEINTMNEITIVLTTVENKDLAKLIEMEGIIKVKDKNKYRVYVIDDIIKDSINETIIIKALHTYYTTLNAWVDDVRPTNQNGHGAINELVRNAYPETELTFVSNINTINTAYYVCKSLYACIHNDDTAFLNRWGGELLLGAYDIEILEKIGRKETGIVIEKTVNMINLDANENKSELVTRIYPKGYNGITIPSKYIDSPIVKAYRHIYPKEYKFEHIKVKEVNSETGELEGEGFDTLEQAQEELIKCTNQLFEKSNIDKLSYTYNVSYQDLSDTLEYENLASQIVFLGDYVKVFDNDLGININLRVIKRSYDLLLDEMIEVTISNNEEASKNIIDSVIDSIDKVEQDTNDKFNWYDKAIESATDLINNGLKDSHVVVKKDEILIMDTDDVKTALNIWRWNKNGLGFSETGYEGPFETAITQDGTIVAKFLVGLVVKGENIDAKNLVVYNTKDGAKTFEVTAGGDVNISANNFTLQGKDVSDIAKEEAGKKINELSQLDIFNILTNNGVTQGIYLNNGKIYVNGEYIRANSITADKIEGRHLYGVSITTQDYGVRSVLTGDGINFYSDFGHAGKLSYDSTGAGSSSEASDRLWLRSLGGYALKVQSSGNMSLSANEGYNNIYAKANMFSVTGRFYVNGTEITGSGGVAVFG